jgi:hypothetical protein
VLYELAELFDRKRIGKKRSREATETVQCQRKRISFNLSKNLVHQIGKPLPPPELRTPPSAKPSGSALKKGSSIGVKSVARKLTF